MIIEMQEHSAASRYFMMTQTVLPRPIAWVMTMNEDGGYNLAPFSYFNCISSDPPLVMISVGRQDDGRDKDTHRNLRERRFCTVHIASEQHLDAVNASAETLAINESELDKIGLDTTLFGEHPVPRLSDCHVAFACELADIHAVGNTPQAVIYLEIKQMFIDDDIVSTQDNGRIKVHADKLRPLSRMGAGEYMGFGGVMDRERPA